MSKISSFLLFSLVILCENVLQTSSSCNEAVCASIVSKCMLTQSCKCNLKNCTCCRDCYNCLDDLYYECCSCVEMCPKSDNLDVPLSKTSHVGDLPEKLPELFNALTEEQDQHLRWVAYSFPMHREVSFITPSDDKQWTLVAVSTSQDIKKLEDEFLNCTVAFMSQCISWNKCKESCNSMGASSYRWFHDGCCECVGDTCLNYGINTSKCLKCSAERQEVMDDLDEAAVDLSEVGSNETGDETRSGDREDVTSSDSEEEGVKDVNPNESVYGAESE